MANKKMSVIPQSKIQPTPEDFVRGANIQEPSEYPWLDPRVREDVIKPILLRLKEPIALKLEYLSKITNKSQQAILLEIVIPGIEEMVRQKTGI